LFVVVVSLTCVEQGGTQIGDAVKREILALLQFNKDTQNLAESSAVKEVNAPHLARWRSQ
jgi:hypothetical protein